MEELIHVRRETLLRLLKATHEAGAMGIPLDELLEEATGIANGH